MDKNKITFKRYCWSIGTTSYRTDNFNFNIEKQLKLMNDFRNLFENRDINWEKNRIFQQKYYKFMKDNNFVTGNAKRPDKDAREKTSGLVEIGLMDQDRNVTDVGKKLIQILDEKSYNSENVLQIPRDSYIYLKQLIKTHDNVDGKVVRPFVVFLYVVSKLDYLTNDEFKYLLPLCIDKSTTNNIIDKILKVRCKKISFDEIIISTLLEKENYIVALSLLINNKVTVELICKIGISRKSKKYDKPYYDIYIILKQIVFNHDENMVVPLFDAIKRLSNATTRIAWKKCLFSSSVRGTICKKKIKALSNNEIFSVSNEKEFKIAFFKLMHLFKAKSTLKDYFDLNRRYFKITDIVLFEDNRVKLDIIPKCYFTDIVDELFKDAFNICDRLNDDIPIEDISPCLLIDENKIYKNLGEIVGQDVKSSSIVKGIIKGERYSRFNKLIDEHFSVPILIKLLDKFESRDDEYIKKMVTNNADVPTIFEYILGVIWYIMSDRKGDILEYMNLSLESDLLPKTHAGGGKADIVYKYNKNKYYPKHTLLIEATLADGVNQRRMEMEPVSRHLGEYRLKYPDESAYCIFITTYLHINVIADFRARKNMIYYNEDGSKSVCGMKIIPIKTSEIKTLLKNNINYNKLYALLELAYNSNKAAVQWYENDIVKECEDEKYKCNQ